MKMKRCCSCGNKARELYEWTTYSRRTWKHWKRQGSILLYCDMCLQDNLERLEQKEVFLVRLLWDITMEFWISVWERVILPPECASRRLLRTLRYWLRNARRKVAQKLQWLWKKRGRAIDGVKNFLAVTMVLGTVTVLIMVLAYGVLLIIRAVLVNG